MDLLEVEAVDADTVDYLIRYRFIDGTESVETKQLTLQRNGGSFVITSDSSIG